MGLSTHASASCMMQNESRALTTTKNRTAVSTTAQTSVVKTAPITFARSIPHKKAKAGSEK